MSGRVHGHRVREPRVVSRPGPSSQCDPVANTSSSLAQAWAAFGEAKSALEKLNSSPPAKSNHAHPPPPAPPPTTTAGETHASVAGYRGSPRPASSGGKREGSPSGPGKREKSSESGKREKSSGKKERQPQKAGSERASRRAREEGRRGRREKDGSVSLSTPASHKSTAIPSPHPHTSTTLPSSHRHSNSTAVFGPPVSFGTPTPHSGNSPTLEDKYSKPSGVSQSSPPKINLPEDTLATLRSKVEAQKQAVEATNSRLQSLRRPPVTSAPCIYPLPEVTQSSGSSSSALPTITSSHPHPPPPPSLPTRPNGAAKHQPTSHKVPSAPPPHNPPPSRRVTTGTTLRSVASSRPRGRKTGGPMVRKVIEVAPPVDPLRSRTRPSKKTLTTTQSEGSRKRQLVREKTPPHTRSWALRPSASSVLITEPDRAAGEVAEPGTKEGERRGKGEEKEGERRGKGGEKEGGKGEEKEGDGRGKAREELAQLLQNLESSSGGEDGEGRRETTSRHPPHVTSVLKRRRLADPEERPLPPPPQTKPYDPAQVQRYIRQKQRERRLEARRREEEEMRGRREREVRQRDLVQRQRRILQANLRSQQRWREKDPDTEPGSPSSLLAHPPPPSLSPSPPRLTTHTPPHLPSPHSSTSPHTYTVSPNPLVPQTTSGPSPPPPEEPIRTTEDQRTSHEDRILALTQSALELKKKIAAEAERLKKARTKMPGHVSITVITATPPPSLTAPPTFDLSPQPDIGSLPGVGNVHRQARLTEEVRRQGEAATQIQALFRGHRVRRNHATSLGRVGDGEEDGIRTNGVLNTPSNGVLRTPASGVLKTVNTSSPSLPLKPAVPSHSVAVQTSTSELHLKPTTVAPTEEASSKVATPPWQKGGGDPLSVINIFTRERSHLQQTLSTLKSQKLSELRQLKTSTPRSQDHTHSTEQPLRSSVEEVPSDYSYSLSFPSLHSSTHSVAGSAHSPSTHLKEFPISSTAYESATPPHSHTVTPSPNSLSSQSHSTTVTPPQTTARADEEIPAITPPGSPSFVSSFTTCSRSRPADQPTPVTSTDPHRGTVGGRLSPRSLGLKLQAELTLLETIEESVRQLSAVEGSRVVTSARQESLSLAELVERQRQGHEREMNLAASRAREVEEKRKRARQREVEARRAREEAERREKERAAAAEGELSRQRREISQQLAEARAAASQAVISSARLQVEAAQNMAVSVATAAAKEAVSAAMVGVAHPTSSVPCTPPHSTPNESPVYSTDFEGSIRPDSLTEEVETGRSLLVPTTSAMAGNSSGESTLTPGGSERGGGGDESQVSIPEVVDGDTDMRPESSFRELLPSESHRKRHSHRSSLTESESRPSSPAHSVPHTPSSLHGDRSPSPFTPGGEDSFFGFMSRMMEQYMKEEEVRSRHRALLLQLREKALKERTKAEMEWLKLKQRRLRGKGDDDKMPSLESRRRGLLKKLEAEQTEIRRLQRAQKEASRERRLLLEQHRAITHMQSSAKYYREKLRRHSAQDHMEHPSTPSPSHHHSPTLSEVASQVSEEEVSSPIPSQLSYSPSPTPSHHSSSTNLLHAHQDQPGSVTMPTETAESTPTIIRHLRHHDMSGGRATAVTPKKTVEATPTKPQTTPTTTPANESEVISEVLDHTPSETVPEEVTPTSPNRTTNYSNDSFEPTSRDHTPSGTDHTLSRPIPVSTPPPEAESEPSSELTSGVGSLEERIGALRQELEKRREEVRRARGEQRERKRALLRDEENRLRRRLETLDNQLAQLQSPTPLQNHLPPLHSSTPPSPPPASQQPPPVSSHSPSPRTTGDTTEEAGLSAVVDATLPEEVEEKKEGERSEAESVETEVSELSPSIEEEDDNRSSVESLSLPSKQASVEPSLGLSAELALDEPREPGQAAADRPLGERELTATEEQRSAGEEEREVTVTRNGEMAGREELVARREEEEEASYTETWASYHSSLVAGNLSSSEKKLDDEPAEYQLQRGREGEMGVNGQVEEVNAAREGLTMKVTVNDGETKSTGGTDGIGSGGVGFTIGQRVLMGGAEPGTVRFIGSTHFAAGVWIGVELDAEKGKNDGSIDDERYFNCPAGYGVFAPISKISLLEEEDEEERKEGVEGEERGGSEESSVPEEVAEDEFSEGSGDAAMSEEEEPEITLSPRPQETQGNEGEREDTTFGPLSEGTHPGPGEMAEVQGSRDLEPSSPAVPPPLTLPQEDVPTAPHLAAPPPDIAREAPKQTAEPQTAHLTTSVDHLTSDLVQELANEAFQTMHRIWRHRSPSSPTSPSSPRPNHILETPVGPRRNNHHLRRDLEPAERDVMMRSLEQRKREKPELSLKADKISDQLLALLLKSETDLVCALRSSKSSPEPPSSPHRHGSPALFSSPSLPTIQETVSPPPSPPLPPPPSSPPPSPPGSPQRHLPPATAAWVAAGERSPPHHGETSPPLTPSLSCASLTSLLLDQQDFTSAHCMVPSATHQTDTIVQHTCSLWNDLRGSSSEPALPPPDCPAHILSLFSQDLSSSEEHCHKAYVRLVYDTTLQVLRDSAPHDPDVSVWTRFSPALNSHLVAARTQHQAEFDLDKVQRRVRGKLVRGQLPVPLPSAKFLHGTRRVGGKDVDFIDLVLIRELRREEASWVDYHRDETAVKLRVADGLLESLLTEAVHLVADIAERKRQKRS